MKIKQIVTWLIMAGIGILSNNAEAITISVANTPPAVGDGVENLAISSDSLYATAHPYVDSDYIVGNHPSGLILGQSFTTGTNEAGYFLSSISVPQVGWGPTSWDYTGGNVTLKLFSLAGEEVDFGGVQTQVGAALVEQTAAVGGAAGGMIISNTPSAPMWLTVTLDAPVALVANTLYGFTIASDGTDANDGFFMEWDGLGSNPYAGGGSLTVPPAVGDYWSGGTGSDRAFVAVMEASAVNPPFHTMVVSPADKSLGITNPVTISATIENWGTTYANSTMYFDGEVVSATVSNSGSTNIIFYTVPSNLVAQSVHTVAVSVVGADDGVASNEWVFTMGGDPGYGIYIYSNTLPVVDADDIYQFSFASATANNVENGDYNATFAALDHPAPGQTFTTDSGAGTYELSSVWVKHVEGYDTWCDNYQIVDLNARMTLRITDPLATGTTGFVLYETELVVLTNSGPALSNSGEGNWFEFRLPTTFALSGDTRYGFDVGVRNALGDPQENDYWELAGVNTNAYVGGGAYVSGVGGDGDNTLTARTGDRVFLLKLAAAGPSVIPDIQSISASGGAVTLMWNSEAGVSYGVLSKSSLTAESWTDVTTVPGAAGTTMTTVPAESDQEYFRIKGN